MLFRSNDTATTEIYTPRHTLSLHDAPPIDIRTHWPDIPPALADAIMACLAADPARRPPTLDAFLKLVAGVQA